MKKITLSLFCLLFISAAFAQSTKLRVAVSFDTDDTFTLLGAISTKTLEIDLTDALYKQIEMLVDTNYFVLKREIFPVELSAANNPSNTGIPKASQLQNWVKKLRNYGGYDLLLIIYKPIQTSGTYSNLCGFSYGLSTSKGIVFSLNNALVYDLSTMKLLATSSIESESDFIAGSFAMNKALPNDHASNIEKPVQMINKLNQEFALKAFQCLQTSKKKLVRK